jgi:hypothetical protein
MNFVDYLTNAAVDIYYTIKNIHEHYCVIIEDLIYLTEKYQLDNWEGLQ